MEHVLLSATAREADSEIIDRPDRKQVRTPSSLRPNHNKVIVARFDSEPGANAGIAAIVADHRERGARMNWFVGPSSSPANLGQRLLAHGLQVIGPSMGMGRVIGNDDFPLDLPGLTVKPVASEADLHEYADVSVLAWERDQAFREAMVHIGRAALERNLPTRSWIASIDGEPVATSHLRLMDECGYLQGCAVIPSRRRQGLYRALVHHRLAYLREQGLDLAVIWAAAGTSGQGCLKLGFSAVCEGTFYELPDAGPQRATT